MRQNSNFIEAKDGTQPYISIISSHHLFIASFSTSILKTAFIVKMASYTMSSQSSITLRSCSPELSSGARKLPDKLQVLEDGQLTNQAQAPVLGPPLSGLRFAAIVFT